MRGMWRWWEETGGGDRWWARVEMEAGRWADVAQVEYERAGHQPAFWDLPLKEDYLAYGPSDADLAQMRNVNEVRENMVHIGIVVAALFFFAALAVTAVRVILSAGS